MAVGTVERESKRYCHATNARPCMGAHRADACRWRLHDALMMTTPWSINGRRQECSSLRQSLRTAGLLSLNPSCMHRVWNLSRSIQKGVLALDSVFLFLGRCLSRAAYGVGCWQFCGLGLWITFKLRRTLQTMDRQVELRAD